MPTLPEYELFLAFPLAAARMAELRQTVLALEVNSAMARMAGVDVYYRSDTDVMLLGLRFDARTATHTLLARVRAEAEAAEAAVLEPARLPPDEADRFRRMYLPLYSFCLRDFPTVSDAVRSLARDLGLPQGDGPAGSKDRRAAPAKEHERTTLEVRFRRGDEWQLGRARSLTREGIYVCTGAVPRVGDVVELNLTAGESTLNLRSQVVHVTREDAAAALGNAGFGARFLIDTAEERQRLEAIVQAGRVEGLGTVRPAPPRREARYPIRWPVFIDTKHGSSPGAALDVSCHGLFVSLAGRLAGDVEVSLPIDDLGEPIRASGRVARTIPKDVAQARGVSSGYGIELSGFSPSDETRFRMFVGRIRSRSERTVLVGAAPDRATELTAQLVAAGYVASGVSDPREIVRKAMLSPPDLVLVDQSLDTANRGARALRKALATKNVMTYFLEPNQAPQTLRSLADAALLG
jgi:PilZ domain-containing protein